VPAQSYRAVGAAAGGGGGGQWSPAQLFLQLAQRARHKSTHTALTTGKRETADPRALREDTIGVEEILSRLSTMPHPHRQPKTKERHTISVTEERHTYRAGWLPSAGCRPGPTGAQGPSTPKALPRSWAPALAGPRAPIPRGGSKLPQPPEPPQPPRQA